MKEIERVDDFIFYTGSDGKIHVQVAVEDETIWATQRGLAEIFGTTRENITMHISNVFKEEELDQNSVCKEILHTAQDNKQYKVKIYNLDLIIAVGYRVNSYQATQFRIWATKILKEYLLKGFALDDDRLKQGKKLFGKDYFDELLERIREIRASERRFYQRITDIYQQCSSDYDSKSPITRDFFATVQNKLEYAITHKTAPEIIRTRANAIKPHMGLETWDHSPKGKILKKDVTVAKNYLNVDEMSELNIVVNMYLDYAELQAKRFRLMKMADWVERLDSFLKFNDYDVLHHAGTIKSEVAKAFAEKEYAKFRVIQDQEYESDFDKVVERIKTKQLPKEGEKTELKMPELDEDDKKAMSDFDKFLKGLTEVPPPKKNSGDGQ